MTKKIIALMSFTVFSSSIAYADVADTVADVAKHAITTAGQVAMADRTKVEMDNVTMTADTKMEESGVLGTNGNEVSADEIKMSNVTMDAKTDMKRSVVIGVNGNKVGSGG